MYSRATTISFAPQYVLCCNGQPVGAGHCLFPVASLFRLLQPPIRLSALVEWALELSGIAPRWAVSDS